MRVAHIGVLKASAFVSEAFEYVRVIHLDRHCHKKTSDEDNSDWTSAVIFVTIIPPISTAVFIANSPDLICSETSEAQKHPEVTKNGNGKEVVPGHSSPMSHGIHCPVIFWGSKHEYKDYVEEEKRQVLGPQALRNHSKDHHNTVHNLDEKY